MSKNSTRWCKITYTIWRSLSIANKTWIMSISFLWFMLRPKRNDRFMDTWCRNSTAKAPACWRLSLDTERHSSSLIALRLIWKLHWPTWDASISTLTLCGRTLMTYMATHMSDCPKAIKPFTRTSMKKTSHSALALTNPNTICVSNGKTNSATPQSTSSSTPSSSKTTTSPPSSHPSNSPKSGKTQSSSMTSTWAPTLRLKHNSPSPSWARHSLEKSNSTTEGFMMQSSSKSTSIVSASSNLLFFIQKTLVRLQFRNQLQVEHPQILPEQVRLRPQWKLGYQRFWSAQKSRSNHLQHETLKQMEHPQLSYHRPSQTHSLHVLSRQFLTSRHDFSKISHTNQAHTTVFRRFNWNGSCLLRQQIRPNWSRLQTDGVPEHEKTLTDRFPSKNWNFWLIDWLSFFTID